MADTIIEKGIPMPSSISNKGRPNPYIFNDMDIGDSVFFKGGTASMKCKSYASAVRFGKSWKKSFSGATVDGGVRIWRTA